MMCASVREAEQSTPATVDQCAPTLAPSRRVLPCGTGHFNLPMPERKAKSSARHCNFFRCEAETSCLIFWYIHYRLVSELGYRQGMPMPEWEYISLNLSDLPFKPGIISVL